MSKVNKLKILDSIAVKSPCQESWDEMKGDSKSRFCDKCQHTVTDLSTLTKNQAAILLANSNRERLCVRYYTEPSGKIKFKERLLSARHLSRVSYAALALIFSVLGFSQIGLADSQGSSCKPNDIEQRCIKLGKIAVVKPSPTGTKSPQLENSNPSGHTMGEPMPVREENQKELELEPTMGLVAPPTK